MLRHLILLSGLFCITQAIAQGFASPQPYGGMDAVKWMVEQEQQFPEEALQAGIEGDVGVAFNVKADGSVNHLRVSMPLCTACDTEALRLVRLIRWRPASTEGTAFETDHSIAIPFSAKRYKKALTKNKGCAPLELTRPAEATGALYADKEVDTLATPIVPSGLRGLGTYIANNLRYPEEAYRRDIQGKVVIEFVVEASGSLSNMRAMEHLGAGCDDEAMRLVRSICWKPAIRKGERVRSIMKLDIQFRLDPSKRP